MKTYVLNREFTCSPFDINHNGAIKYFLEEYMPKGIITTEGSIINSSLNISPPLDSILYDDKRSFTSNGLRYDYYIPQECVYAFGQHYSYWKEDHFHDFLSISKRIFDHLTSTDRLKKCFLQFMYIDRLGDYNKCNEKYSFEFIEKIYQETNWSFLPSFLCILNKGIVINVSTDFLEKGVFKPNLIPATMSTDKNDWVFIRTNHENNSQLFQIIYYILLEHLRTTEVNYPNVIDYAQSTLEIELA